ncbi:PilZ domain-containing protein [bacterium]|nr:PilZ domain-containing protein [bacterium]
MENNEVEKRTCIRFAIPGATVSYEFKDYTEEFSPLVDISRGGVKFLGKHPLETNADITLKISVPGEMISLTLHGKVRWISFIEEKDQYQIGVQFNPYGEKERQNYPGNLVKIISLEQKFAPTDKAKVGKYEIDS